MFLVNSWSSTHVTLNAKRVEAASKVIHASKTLAHGETEIGSCDQAGRAVPLILMGLGFSLVYDIGSFPQ